MIQYQELNQSIYSMHVTCNTVQHGKFYHPFENKDSIFQVELVSDLANEFCSCVDIKVNFMAAMTM